MSNFDKTQVDVVYTTPIEIGDIAIGTCWDKQKEECDHERIYRVSRKFKHQSTIEHLRVIYLFKVNHNDEEDKRYLENTDVTECISFFINDPFSKIEVKDDETYVVSTNLRVLMSAYDNNLLSKDLLIESIIPDEYRFLFTGDNDEC